VISLTWHYLTTGQLLSRAAVLSSVERLDACRWSEAVRPMD